MSKELGQEKSSEKTAGGRVDFNKLKEEQPKNLSEGVTHFKTQNTSCDLSEKNLPGNFDNQKQNHPPSDNLNKDELYSDKKPSLDTKKGKDLITPTQTENTRQVIAVSASKGPAAFFNLARKFLVTDETCDLSALEGAIISAVDAAHLLERSKLAKIIRYVVICQGCVPKMEMYNFFSFQSHKNFHCRYVRFLSTLQKT